MAISKNFEQFMNDVNEASLKGNIGIPGEGNTQGPSWLDKTNREQQDKVRDFERNNMGLLQNFPRFIQEISVFMFLKDILIIKPKKCVNFKILNL